MLELMRGIQSQPLRKEFLKQRDPTLETLLQIANNWQRSSDVTKNMESSVDVKKTTSNYQKGKKNDWKAKSGSSPGDKKDTPSDKSPKSDNKAEKNCHLCSFKDHQGKKCFALKLTCHNCNKVGHIQSVCKIARDGTSFCVTEDKSTATPLSFKIQMRHA